MLEIRTPQNANVTEEAEILALEIEASTARLRAQSGPMKRVRTVRVITYQGPEKWVDNILARMITGTTYMGATQYVIGELLEQKEEPVDENIEPDHHISTFWGTVTDSGLKLHEEMEAKLSMEVKD